MPARSSPAGDSDGTGALRTHRLWPDGQDVGDGTVTGLVSDIVALHATAATTPYLSLAARLAGFERDALDQPLYQEHSLLRLRCMRGTVFILPRGFAAHAVAATQRRAIAGSRRFLAGQGIAPGEYEQWSHRVLDELRAGPLAVRALRARLGAPPSLSPIINLMCDELLLLRDRPVGGWRDLQYTYALADQVWPPSERPPIDEEAARRSLIAEYIRAFGPVTVGDIAWWTGLPRRSVMAALTDLGAETTAALDAASAVGHCLPGTGGGGLPSGTAKTLTRGGDDRAYLLPALDCYVMGYQDRRHYLDDVHRDYVLDRSGNATSVILHRGRIAGVWDAFAQPEPELALLVFPGFPADQVLAGVEGSALRAAQVLFGGPAPVTLVRTMRSLRERRAGWMMKPLHE